MSDLLTIREAAARRGCTESAIRNAIADGRLEAYDSPAGERHVWADDVDRMDAPRQPGNRSSGEPVLPVDEVPGDDAAVRRGFDDEEIGFLGFCLAYTCARARLHIRERPVSQRLLRRFYRLTTTKEPA